MISPFGMFWSSLMNPPNLDELLSKVKSIDEILEEENIVNSLKQQGNKLANHLKQRPEQFKLLVNYVYEEQKGENQKQQYKYPMIVSDIFAIENPKLINLFFEKFEPLKDTQDQDSSISENNSQIQDSEQKLIDENDDQKNTKENNDENKQQEDLIEENEKIQEEQKDETENEQQKETICDGKQILDYLLSFLYSDQDASEMNQTLAGYFAKTIGSIINVKGLDFIEYIYKEKFDIFDGLLKKIGCKSLSDLFWRLLIIDTNDREDNQCLYLEQRKIIIDKMMIIYTNCDDFELQDSITNILCDIFEKCTLIESSNEIIQHIFKNENFELIRAKIRDQSQFILHNTCKIFNQMINYIANQQSEQKTEDDVVIDPSELYPQIQEKIQILLQDTLKIISEKDVKENNIVTTYGSYQNNFGSGQLKLLEIVLNSFKISLKNQIFDKTNLSQLMVYQKYYKQFMIDYTYNNFVQIIVEKILTHILTGDDQNLRILLFEDCQLINFIVKNMQNQFYTIKDTDKQFKQGYLAQFIQLSNKINEQALKNDYIKDQLTLDWDDYTQSILELYNKSNNTDIGNMKGQEEEERQKAAQAQDLDSIFKKYSHLFDKSEENQESWEQEEKEDNMEVEEYEQDEYQCEQTKLENTKQEQENNQQKIEVQEEFIQNNFWKIKTFDLDDIINDLS